MKRHLYQDKETVYLPRSEKHCHVVVNEDIHFALREYATKHNLSLASATAKLIRRGLLYELNQLEVEESRANFKDMVSKLIQKQTKER